MIRGSPIRKVMEKKRKNGEIIGYMITLPSEFVEILKRRNTRFIKTRIEGDKLIVEPASPEEVAKFLARW